MKICSSLSSSEYLPYKSYFNNSSPIYRPYWTYFAELKNAEILRERLNLVNEVSPYIGKYFSVEYVRKNVLRQSDEDILDIDNQIRKEIKQGIIANPEGAQMEDDESTDINIGDN